METSGIAVVVAGVTYRVSVAIIAVGIRHFGVKLPQCGTNMRESGKMVEIQVAEILTKRLFSVP